MVCRYLNLCNQGQSAMDCNISVEIGGKNLISFCIEDGQCGKTYTKMKEEEFELDFEPKVRKVYFFEGGYLL